MDNKKQTNNAAIRQHLTFEDRVIKKIAGTAAEEISGVLTVSGNAAGGFVNNIADRFIANDDVTRGIDVDTADGQVAITMNVVCPYGQDIPQLFDTMADKIARALLNMTGLAMRALDVHVMDVLLPDDFEKMVKSQAAAAAKAAKEQNADMAKPTVAPVS